MEIEIAIAAWSKLMPCSLGSPVPCIPLGVIGCGHECDVLLTAPMRFARTNTLKHRAKNVGDSKMANYSDGEWDKISSDDIDGWAESGPATPLLDTVNFPIHLKNFNSSQLRQLCKEIRSEIVNTVSKTGGHLGASLGVVELTVAMHYVFSAPEDKIIFDVGHQCYGHKILTGRRKRMASIRQTDGLSGRFSTLQPELLLFIIKHSRIN